ncbi:MAG: hypothetical protein HGA65_14790 [Oscillochloris sp.]|nr:hypothetical protein [Oscillochloris sp.]
MRDISNDLAAAKMLSAALAGSSVTVAELDSSLHYCAVYSPGALLGGQAVLGRTLEEVHGPYAPPLIALARQAQASGEAQECALALGTGPSACYLRLRITPVDVGNGELRLALLVFDLTCSEHVGATSEWLSSQVLERERLAATGRLAASVAHEVNTPLQAIESCLHLAGRVSDQAERTRYLRLAREEIQRVGYTLRHLLDLYRPSAADAPLDVNGLIDRVLVLTTMSLNRRAIKVACVLSNDLPVVVGRADEITQVLINLVFNAMHAMPQGGQLCIESDHSMSADGHPLLILRVADSGVGITPELHQQIFEPFFTTRSDGTGLGLAICRQIVESHGGALRVVSTPHVGSCFTIELPALTKQ